MHYVYVFVRQDLSWPDIVVQACHAAMESQKAQPTGVGINFGYAQFTVPTKQDAPNLVLIGIRNKEKLAAVQAELTGLAITAHSFVEPDMNSELTAVATEYLREDDPRRKTLGRYKLLNESKN